MWVLCDFCVVFCAGVLVAGCVWWLRWLVCWLVCWFWFVSDCVLLSVCWFLSIGLLRLALFWGGFWLILLGLIARFRFSFGAFGCLIG